MLIHNTLAILFSIISPFILIINQKHPLMFLRSLTTEAMGIWRFAGAFTVVKRQSECGSKTAGMHVSQPMNIGVC
jgi:hypothetical protein